MFKLIRLSSNGYQPLIAFNCKSVNKIIVRTKRNTFSRRPVKILTDSGKDYFKQTDFKEPVSSADFEIDPKLLDRKERHKYNKYYDEGLAEELSRDNSDYEWTSEEEERQPKVKTLKNSKDSKDKNRIESKPLFRPKTDYSNRERSKSEKVLKPKIAGIPVYERLGDSNKEFINLMSTHKQKKRREKENIMLLEGKRLITDAIEANCQLKTIYFTQEENLVGIPGLEDLVAKGTKLKKILYRDMQLFSDVITAPGVMAVSERPSNKNLLTIRNSFAGQVLPLILIGENVRDPGNLGTMVRCAAAVGAQKLVLMKGCADVWETKVLRSGAGAHFRVPIVNNVEWPLVFNHIPIEKPFDLFIADSNDNFNNKAVKFDTKPADSLKIPSHTVNTITKEVDILSDETFLRDESYDDSNPELKNYRNLSIASIPYCDTKYYNMGIERPAVLVIGGETHGLSDQSYKLAYDYIGRKIKIPLALGVDSLNSAVAAAVIMYEMKRQYECRSNCCQELFDSNV